MNSKIQGKIDEIKKLSAQSKPGRQSSYKITNTSSDSLSMAIRNKKDADTFMAELKALKK
ncbi:hypothetical protein [Deminuibacter soli]|uniref:Uncharacterized protein n=1 Tax=Deminuibacter soli TaxID=2291815 RepID=A0A3E1NE72_9BACT|nr:hypothetical protein [Deminuibacter soli]RFM26266.1 hypothetical protein DXN05_20360 [Deminuibacter soli]